MTVTNVQSFAVLPPAVRDVVAGAADVWTQGGWGMYALAANGVIMFAVGARILLRLAACGAVASPDRAWSAWQRDSANAKGPLGRMVAGAMRSGSDLEIAHYFDAVRSDEVAPFERDQRVLKISVTSAPLLGLLGTVTGMLATFNALAIGGGGDKTMGMIAGGISEALITTEVGLVMALAGLMFQQALLRGQERYGKIIAHLESLCLQRMHRTGQRVAGTGAAEGALAAAPEGAA